ncbi:hypothetical protein GXW78_08870 [Roseomonas terrae]|jgi:hypothetical protein|uniref:DUF6285 domain-containing protein n=1 Tax=Neoroseomonas terrae TaxID=424799 RepID=A0ABS5EFH6_9PROT|nr:DUF6285 domain-containing protein [Neoroseomonas terrae]MBR0649773.1 hypothetical protein [Neoroseomonas terrae]
MDGEDPQAADLLATARDVLLNDLLPALPSDKAFAARMIANAMAIAARAAEATPGPDADLRALAADIRAGRCDPGSARHAETAALLDAITRARCAVSAPRALG